MLGRVIKGGSIKLINIGSVSLSVPQNWNGTISGTIDLKNKIPYWRAIKEKNLIAQLKDVSSSSAPSAHESNSSASISNIVISYDNVNGIAKVTANYAKGYMISQLKATIDLLLISSGGGTKSLYKKWHRLFKKGGVRNAG